MAPVTRSTAKKTGFVPTETLLRAPTRSKSPKKKVAPSSIQRENTQVFVEPSLTGQGVHTRWVYQDDPDYVRIGTTGLALKAANPSGAMPPPLSRYITPSFDHIAVARRIEDLAGAPRKSHPYRLMQYDESELPSAGPFARNNSPSSQMANPFLQSQSAPRLPSGLFEFRPAQDARTALLQRQAVEEQRAFFYDNFRQMLGGISEEDWLKDQDAIPEESEDVDMDEDNEYATERSFNEEWKGLAREDNWLTSVVHTHEDNIVSGRQLPPGIRALGPHGTHIVDVNGGNHLAL